MSGHIQLGVKEVNFVLLSRQPVISGMLKNVVEAEDSDESQACHAATSVTDIFRSQGTVNVAVRDPAKMRCALIAW